MISTAPRRVTATGYRNADGHWALIAAKRVGPVNALTFAWFPAR